MKKKVRVLLLTILTISSTGSAMSGVLFQQGLSSSSNRVGFRERKYGRITFNVAREVRIEVGNRTTGRITIQGWDRDVIEARALSARGEEVVIVDTSETTSEKRFFLKADYADLENPSAPASRVLDSAPSADNRPLEIHLEVSVPRYAEIDQIRVVRSNVEVSDVDTSITVAGGSSSVILKRVGAVEVHTRSGTVEIEEAKGLVEVATASGAIRVNNARAAVHAVSIAGPIEIKCAHDRIDVANTDAAIELVNTDGDVDAVASNSSVRFTGDLRELPYVSHDVRSPCATGHRN